MNKDIVSVKVDGFEEIQDKLERLPKLAAKAIMREGLKAVGKLWRVGMARRVVRGFHVFQSFGAKYRGIKIKGRSREYGVISRSIRTRVSVRGDELEGTVDVGPSRKAFWAGWLEFGRKGERKQPFIRPEFEETKEEALELFKKTTKEQLAANGMPVQ